MLLEPPKCIYLQNQKVMWEPLTGWIKSYFKIYQALPDLLPGCFVVVPASFPPYKRAWPPPILGTGSVLLHPGSTGLSPPLLCLGLSSHLRSLTQLCPALLRHMDYSPPGSSVEFSRQEYWSVLPFPSPGDLPGNPSQVSCVSCIGRQILYH